MNRQTKIQMQLPSAWALLPAFFLLAACDAERPGDDVQTTEASEQSSDADLEEQALYLAALQDDNDDGSDGGSNGSATQFSADIDPQANDNPPEYVNGFGSIPHGGAAFQEARLYHIVGSLCSAGRVRAGRNIIHAGGGWGGFDGWLAPNNLRDCRARVWTQNAAGFSNGVLTWTIFEEPSLPGHADYCTAFGPCGDEDGDCDTDSDCGAGLSCVYNVGATYDFEPWVDVCLGATPGDADYCAVSGPCASGEGDCDGDSECSAGLSCVNDVGPAYGFAGWVDVCEQVLPNGHFAYCSAGNNGPCAYGEGDCDNNSECAGSLTCGTDNGPAFGLAAWVDVCI